MFKNFDVNTKRIRKYKDVSRLDVFKRKVCEVFQILILIKQKFRIKNLKIIV